jgi:hypothetical protein
MHGSRNVKVFAVIWNELNTFVCQISSLSGYKECQRQNILIVSYRLLLYTWVISNVMHTVCFLFKHELILHNTFTGLQCNLHCALSQWTNVWASLIFLSGRLRC